MQIKSNNLIISKLVLLLAVLFVSACDAPPPKSVFKQRAENLAEQLIQTMVNEQYQESVKLYDKRFFERLRPEEWQTILSRINKKLGKYQSHQQSASSVSHGYSKISTSTTVLVYRINYEKSYTVQKLTFTSDAKAENMKLVGHYIDFPKQPEEKEN